MRNILILFIAIYMVRVFVYLKFFAEFDIKPIKAVLPIVGDIIFLKRVTRGSYAAAYVLFALLFCISVFTTITLGDQMKVIMAQGMETYARINGTILPYHTFFYISEGVLTFSFVGLTILRFIICQDIQKAFGRLNMERWMMFLLPPIGYLGLVTHDFKYYGNPYQEGFVDFSVEF